MRAVKLLKMSAWSSKRIRGVLLDITGVLYNSGYDGGTIIDGSITAVSRLYDANIPVRFVTNETQITRRKIAKKLRKLGYTVNDSHIFSPAPAICKLLKERNLRPYFLVHPGIMPEFDTVDIYSPTCVVVGDAEHYFTFESVNKAFQILMKLKEPVLISMGKGKYYRQDNQLQIDLGAYVSALEYACDLTAEVVGKPSKEFFLRALEDINVAPENAVMVGDDILHDVGGAINAGMQGILVRTGKYRPSDENHPTVIPTAVVDNLSKAVDLILNE